MKILQIGATDLQGARFNGHDLHLKLRARGHVSFHCVWDRQSEDPHTWQLTGRRLNGVINRVERGLSLQATIQPFAWQLLAHPAFRAADVVHYHILHAGYFSLYALPTLTRRHPSVWTLHDPWALTGHCVHPYDCERWKTGCGDCPSLDTPMPLKTDRTAFLWRKKRQIYAKSKFHVVVSSAWMRNLVNESPLFQGVRVHEVPFGVDQSVFRPLDQMRVRARLNIPPQNFVICFRATPSEFKGLPFIVEVLRRLRSSRPISLIALQHKGQIDEFRNRFHIVEPGWVADEHELASLYAASDVLLMPSMADSFGMMAIESMSCGTPVITFEGTAVPAIIHAPEAGIAVPKGDARALAAALEMLMADVGLARDLGRRALAIAQTEYDAERHVDRMLRVYEEAISDRINAEQA